MEGTDTSIQGRLEGLVVLRLWALQVLFDARLSHELAAIGLTKAEFRLVGEVMGAPEGVRQGELARRLGVRPPTVSAALARLEGSGVVVRTRDPDDPRARLVALAPGAPILPGVDLLERLDADLLGELGPGERERLVDLLARLAARLAIPAPE